MTYAFIKRGERFNKWTTIRSVRWPKGKSGGFETRWLCQCDCGIKKAVQSGGLRNGKSKSCGCGPRNIPIKHGLAGTRIYMIWAGMLQRCNNPKATAYKRYGGRDITVCDRWHNFENFIADMGQPVGDLSIDRINNDGNYEPANCRWVTMQEQLMNKRNNRLVTFNGKTQCITHWARDLGVNDETLRHRHKMGWSAEKILDVTNLTPIQ